MGDLGLIATLRRLSDAGSSVRRVGWADGAGSFWWRENGLWLKRAAPRAEGFAVIDGASVGVPRPAEREAFLASLRRWDGIVVGTARDGTPLAVEEGGVSVVLVHRAGTRVSVFDRVRAREIAFARAIEHVRPRSRPAAAERMRQALDAGTDLPRIRGASADDARVYEIARGLRGGSSDGEVARRLSLGLAPAHGRLLDWKREPPDLLSVAWEPLEGRLAGRRIESRIEEVSFGVRTAGICVVGLDAQFDLTALASAVARQDDAGISGWGDEYVY